MTAPQSFQILNSWYLQMIPLSFVWSMIDQWQLVCQLSLTDQSVDTNTVYWSLSFSWNHPILEPQMILTHRQCSEQGPTDTVFQMCNLSQELLVIVYMAIFSSSSTHPSTCCLAQPQNGTRPACNKQSGLQRRLIRLTFPLSKTCTFVGSGKGQLTSL